MNRRKYINVILILLLSNPYAFNQVLKPAKWEITVEALKAFSRKKEAVVRIDVSLEDNWYIYSSDHDRSVGPLPTTIEFEAHESYELVGDLKPIGVRVKFDEVWMDSVRYMKKKGRFEQRIKVLKTNPKIKGRIIYSVCSTKTGMCIFPEEDFEISGIAVK